MSYAQLSPHNDDSNDPEASQRIESDWKEYATVTCPDPVHPEVMQLAEADPAAEHLRFVNVAGPAIKAIFLGPIVIFIFVMCFPPVVWKVSTCPNGMLYGNDQRWLTALYLPVFFALTWMEWRCFSFVILPYVQALQPFKLFGIKWSLRSWIVITFLASSTAKLDILTSSLFVAKVLKGYTCNGPFWKSRAQAWHTVAHASILANVPLISKLYDNLWVAGIVGWSMIHVQLIAAFLESYPTDGPCGRDYGLKQKGEREEGYTTPWIVLKCLHGKTYHADVLRVLATASRTLSIVEKSCQWQMKRVNDQCEACKVDENRNPKKQHRCFDMVRREARNCGFRLWFVNIFQKAFVLETQVSLYALELAIAPAGTDHDYWGIFAIIISFLTLFHALSVAGDQLKSLTQTHKEAVDTITNLTQQQQDQEDGEGGDDWATRFERCTTWLLDLPRQGTLAANEEYNVLSAARDSKIKIIVRMKFGRWVLFFILVHTFVKFMATFFCHGFWLIPNGSTNMYGCIDLSNIPHNKTASR